ncbi:hypothetical protein L7F22_002280 [Adiantum nelumboides]|nr:hypothetical protein [Adiantum nelumboides]
MVAFYNFRWSRLTRLLYLVLSVSGLFALRPAAGGRFEQQNLITDHATQAGNKSSTIITAQVMHRDLVFSPFSSMDMETWDGAGEELEEEELVQVYSGAHYARSNHYLVRIIFGGGDADTQRELFLLMDTGSGFTWIQCQPCTECQAQVDAPIFDPATSPTLHYINLYDALCVDLHAGNASWHPGDAPFDTLCPPYRRGYAGGAIVSGSLAMDTITLPSFSGAQDSDTVSLPSMPFGCTTAFKPAAAAGGFAGVLGLSRGELGFPSLLQKRGHSGSFSYCLPRLHSANTSTLTFGGAVAGPSIVFTPLLKNPPFYHYSPYYYVELLGISVNGDRLSNIPSYLFDINPNTGKGGLIIDSGAPITTLPGEAYTELRDAIREAIFARSEPKPRLYSAGLMETCFMVGVPIEEFYSFVPTVTFHFAEGADLEIPPQNLFLPRQPLHPQVCLYIQQSVHSLSVLGSMAHQGIRMTFDPEGNRVGFEHGAC